MIEENSDIELCKVGSRFDDFLREDGINEDVQEEVVTWALKRRISQLMEEGGVSKTEMARRLATSRSQLDRLLSTPNDKITIETLARMARVVGCDLKIELV